MSSIPCGFLQGDTLGHSLLRTSNRLGVQLSISTHTKPWEFFKGPLVDVNPPYLRNSIGFGKLEDPSGNATPFGLLPGEAGCLHSCSVCLWAQFALESGHYNDNCLPLRQQTSAPVFPVGQKQPFQLRSKHALSLAIGMFFPVRQLQP